MKPRRPSALLVAFSFKNFPGWLTPVILYALGAYGIPRPVH
jgi:hypothetical protein